METINAQAGGADLTYRTRTSLVIVAAVLLVAAGVILDARMEPTCEEWQEMVREWNRGAGPIR